MVKQTLKKPRHKLPPGPGRPKGIPNKSTKLLKDAILIAAEEAGHSYPGKEAGLIKYLRTQAISNPGPFMSLLGKVLPMQMVGSDDEPLAITVVLKQQ
tara:strand:+ start:556 stop:849 length:294 start_codon:yes stop_codon:yes gene_type:complete